MRPFLLSQWLLGAGALMPAILTFTTGFTLWGNALGAEKPDGTVGTASRAVSFLREVRPILAQHCFQCHGPDEAARKGRLRLDLKDQAFARRKGKHVIAPGSPDGSLAWERITTAN